MGQPDNNSQEFSREKEIGYLLWRATKFLKKPVCHKPPLKRENDTWVKENKEKAELFRKHQEHTKFVGKR